MLKEEQAGFSGFFFFVLAMPASTALASDLPARKAEPSYHLQDHMQQACHLKEESEPYILPVCCADGSRWNSRHREAGYALGDGRAMQQFAE